ncbi:unnamed protein product [Phaeothamnion confervicola]
MPLTRELVRTMDGGHFALDWRYLDAGAPEMAPDTPTLLVIHGLNGHSGEAYVRYSLQLGAARGWRVVAMNHRGCGGTRLTSAYSYSAAFTGDLRLAVSHIKRRFPHSPLLAVGFSLGANLLVKYLGEEGSHGGAPVAAAAAVSCPWNIHENPLGHHGLGGSWVTWIYSIFLTLGLQQYLHLHRDNPHLRRRKDLDILGALRADRVSEFDASVTVPLWGYEDLHAYQFDSSSSRVIKDVTTSLLCINAADDAICPPALWPLAESAVNPAVVFVTTAAGGHVGWCEGLNPFTGPSWADRLVNCFFDAALRCGTAAAGGGGDGGSGAAALGTTTGGQQYGTIGQARL